jgi:hypothetical protein
MFFVTVNKKGLTSIRRKSLRVRETGVEPARPKALDPKC